TPAKRRRSFWKTIFPISRPPSPGLRECRRKASGAPKSISRWMKSARPQPAPWIRKAWLGIPGHGAFGIAEHRLDAGQRSFPHLFIDYDPFLRARLYQDAQNVFQGIRFHVLAHGAGADEVLGGKFGLQARDQAAFRQHQEILILGSR